MSSTTICNGLKLNFKCCLLDCLPLNYKKWSRWVEVELKQRQSLTYTLKSSPKKPTIHSNNTFMDGAKRIVCVGMFVLHATMFGACLHLRCKLHCKTFVIVTFHGFYKILMWSSQRRARKLGGDSTTTTGIPAESRQSVMIHLSNQHR